MKNQIFSNLEQSSLDFDYLLKFVGEASKIRTADNEDRAEEEP